MKIRDLDNRMEVVVNGRIVKTYWYIPGVTKSFISANEKAHAFVDGWQAAQKAQQEGNDGNSQ